MIKYFHHGFVVKMIQIAVLVDRLKMAESYRGNFRGDHLKQAQLFLVVQFLENDGKVVRLQFINQFMKI